MDVFFGSNILIEPTNKNVLNIKSTQTLPATDLNFYNGDVITYFIVDGGNTSYGGRIIFGNVTVTNSAENLVCTVGAYNGLSSIEGLGFSKIDTSRTWIPQGGGAYQGINGFGAGSSSGIANGANTGKQGHAANTGVILLYY